MARPWVRGAVGSSDPTTGESKPLWGITSPEDTERSRRRRRDTDVPESIAALEAKEMGRYHKECHHIYDKMKRLKVSVDIEALVDQGQCFDPSGYRPQLHEIDDPVLRLEV